MNIKATILSVIMAGSSLAYATDSTAATAGRVAVFDIHTMLEQLPQVQTIGADIEKQFEVEYNSLTTTQERLKVKLGYFEELNYPDKSEDFSFKVVGSEFGLDSLDNQGEDSDQDEISPEEDEAKPKCSGCYRPDGSTPLGGGLMQ